MPAALAASITFACCLVLLSGFTSLVETKNSFSMPLKASCKDSGALKSAQRTSTPLPLRISAAARFEDDAAKDEAGTCWRRVSRTLRPRPPVTPVTKILGAITFDCLDEKFQINAALSRLKKCMSGPARVLYLLSNTKHVCK